MERFVIRKLKEWKEKQNRKPLVLMGARQVGKNWVMKEFGRQFFKNTAYISFYNNSLAKNLFEEDYDVKRLIPSLSLLCGFNIPPGDRLIIFDEVQEASKAFESFKYFCEEAPLYHIIVARSLLGVALHKLSLIHI